jgi:hypothetical protein
MSKATRLKAARRKQHNKTAKVRAREWAEKQEQWRLENEAARAKRAAEAATEAKFSEPLPPPDPLSKLLGHYLDGSLTPAGLLGQRSGLDVLDIARTVQQIGGISFVDTEGSLGSDGVWNFVHEPGIKPSLETTLKDVKVADPNQYHTEQCKANHRERVIEASRIESELLAKGEEGLAVYLRPTITLCTCDNKPEDEDGSDPA